MTIPARYENGVFRPLEDVQIKEGTVVEVYLPAAGVRRPKSVRDLGIFGMWADRDDITDGVSYVADGAAGLPLGLRAATVRERLSQRFHGNGP